MTSLKTRLTASAIAGLALAAYAQTLALPTHFV